MKTNEGIDGAQALLSEAQAAQVLWEYYKKHKPELVFDVRADREPLRALLIHGVAVEVAFAPFQRDAASFLPVPVTRKKRPSTKARAATQA